MPITITIANHDARIISNARGASHPKEILSALGMDCVGDLLQSSFDDVTPPVLLPDRNGFVHSVTKAYDNHYHLVIRPDDIWLAIVTQFSLYVNAHAEELRGLFVTHEGQKELEVKYHMGNRYSVDQADFAMQIAGLIEKNIVDPELRQWITPQFSTTTQQDVIVASIALMGTMQAYFTYRESICCGIPSVTLLGEKEDYESLLGRIEKLRQYGTEPAAFCTILKPIFQAFVRTFDEPEHDEVREFWKNICAFRGGSGMYHYGGWNAVFWYWVWEGRRQVDPDMCPPVWNSDPQGRNGHIRRPMVDRDAIPSGFTKAPVHIDDNGLQIEAEIVAGSVSMACTSSGRPSAGQDRAVGLDTLQPCLGWFMYEKAP